MDGMIRPMFRRIVNKLSLLLGVKAKAKAQEPEPKVWDIPTPDFPEKFLPRFKRRKAPESWHRFCRQRAQWRREHRDAINAAKGPQLTNHQRSKLAQAAARRFKAGLAA